MNFQNVYTFTYQKTLFHTFLLLVFQTIKSFQCNLKFRNKIKSAVHLNNQCLNIITDIPELMSENSELV